MFSNLAGAIDPHRLCGAVSAALIVLIVIRGRLNRKPFITPSGFDALSFFDFVGVGHGSGLAEVREEKTPFRGW